MLIYLQNVSPIIIYKADKFKRFSHA